MSPLITTIWFLCLKAPIVFGKKRKTFLLLNGMLYLSSHFQLKLLIFIYQFDLLLLGDYIAQPWYYDLISHSVWVWVKTWCGARQSVLFYIAPGKILCFSIFSVHFSENLLAAVVKHDDSLSAFFLSFTGGLFSLWPQGHWSKQTSLFLCSNFCAFLFSSILLYWN